MDENTASNTPQRDTSGDWGGVIGIVIIIVLLIAGGWYFFTAKQAPTNTPAVGAGQA